MLKYLLKNLLAALLTDSRAILRDFWNTQANRVHTNNSVYWKQKYLPNNEPTAKHHDNLFAPKSGTSIVYCVSFGQQRKGRESAPDLFWVKYAYFKNQ